ncbi:MAG: hypothetical protein HDT18_08945 [Oscillibacter sp.]|nr:hypothetical protein [Oscillibacter sp.]
MRDHDRIPMPTPMERKASIGWVLDEALAPERPEWRSLPLYALVFGVEDCLFLAVLLGVMPAMLAFAPADNLAALLPVILFLSSPLLYAAAHGLTMWKESLSGTLEWKRTCRMPLQTLMALRMLLFGGAAVLVCVPVNLLLWQASGGEMPLGRMLGVSFSSLFLHAALSLACRRTKWGPVVPAALWAVLGLFFLDRGTVLPLDEVPTAVFFLLAGAGLAFCAGQLRTMMRRPDRGGYVYAFR